MISEHSSVSSIPGDALTIVEDGESLDGKVALVSMGGRGRGRELALHLASRGASVIIADSELESAEQTAEDIRALGSKAIAVAVDITVKSQVEMLVKYASGIFGSLEFLVNCAGIIYNVSGLIGSKENDLEKLLTHNINASMSINHGLVSGW
ncbi:SDR family NAD(P)-dependent oxidoreductase [Serratia sp. M24T3]|uniref:SDR family NAD(P)-dependent oxidoreductase n=1 Tax=Rouxiella sp. WC2420 TaxID=3234145 RepID=A0AB39VWI0_9GAMM|nr:SDR family NAD(P)-dependent oxidoreductase [Serratia sp. M24T3]EIC86146.1 3-oxoacyl-ACP reductase [Serratia sp. M24T3]